MGAIGPAGPTGATGPIGEDCSTYKYTVAYNDADLNVAGLTANKTLGTLPVAGKAKGVTIKHTAAFTASGLQSLTVQLGYLDGATLLPYSAPFKIHKPVVSGNVTTDGSGVMTVTSAAAHNLIAGGHFTLASCSVAALNGTWTIYSTPSATTLTVTGTGQNNQTATSCAMSTVTPYPDSGYQDDGNVSLYWDAHALTAQFTAVGANLNTLSAGSVTVWVCMRQLP